MDLVGHDDKRHSTGGTYFMSKTSTPIGLVVEWSPRGVQVYDPRSQSTNLLDNLSGLTGYSGVTAIIAVSRRSVFIRTARVPNASREEVRMILGNRMDDLFPIVGTDIAFDFVLGEDVNSEGRLATIAAMPATELSRLLSEARSAGLRVERVIPAALGSEILVKSLNRTSAVVLQPADGGIGIDAVNHKQICVSRVVAQGSNLPGEVGRTLGMIEEQTADVIALGGLMYPGASVELKETALSAISVVPVESLVFNIEDPSAIAQRNRSQQELRLRQSALVAAAAVLLAVYVFVDRSDAASQVDLQIAKNNASLQKKRSERAQAEADALKATAKQTDLERAFLPAQPMGDILTVMSNRLPEGAWLTGISLERGKPVVVRGTAKKSTAVADYLSKLGKDARLRDVKLVFANNVEVDQIPVVNFSVSAFPLGNIPIVDTTKRNP